jgi:hypothetical protein
MGSGEIQNGTCTVTFAQDLLNGVVIDAKHPMRVNVTPTSEMGDFWVEKKNDKFILHAPHAQNGSTFDWRMTAKRKGYEDWRLEYAGPDVALDTFATHPYDNRPNNGTNWKEDVEVARAKWAQMRQERDDAEKKAKAQKELDAESLRKQQENQVRPSEGSRPAVREQPTEMKKPEQKLAPGTETSPTGDVRPANIKPAYAPRIDAKPFTSSPVQDLK